MEARVYANYKKQSRVVYRVHYQCTLTAVHYSVHESIPNHTLERFSQVIYRMKKTRERRTMTPCLTTIFYDTAQQCIQKLPFFFLFPGTLYVLLQGFKVCRRLIYTDDGCLIHFVYYGSCFRISNLMEN